MTEFNLERALAGEPVVTRDGRRVSQIVKLDALNDEFVVFGVIDNSIKSFTIDGEFNPSSGSCLFDLFMATKKYVVKIYKSESGFLHSAIAADVFCGNPAFELIKTIEFEL